MQRKGLKSKTLTLLAIMAFFGVSAPTTADDFFPLDVWEEMASWAKNKVIIHSHDNVTPDEKISIGVNEVGITHASFPFDILKELDKLDGTDWSEWNAFGINYGAAKEDQSNP